VCVCVCVFVCLFVCLCVCVCVKTSAGRPSSNVKIICSVNLQNMLLVYTECWLK
jgi:hypothetical protein